MERETNSSEFTSTEMSRTEDAIEIGMLAVIFLLGGPLNVMSFMRSVRAFRLHKAKSQILLLRLNLNIADLITLFIYVPRQIIWMSTYKWYGGDFLCRINSFFSTFSFYLNSFVITCIAIDRVYGAYNISSLNAHRRAFTRCRNLLAIGWVMAFLFSAPQVLIFRISTLPGFQQCTSWFTITRHGRDELVENMMIPDDIKMERYYQYERILRYEHWYIITHLIFIFWGPCIIIVICYLMVLLILQGHLRQDAQASVLSCWFRTSSKPSFKDEYQSPQLSSFMQNEEAVVIIKMKDDNSYGESTAKPRPSRLGAMAVSTIHKAKQHAKRQAALIILAYLAFWSPYNVLSVMYYVYPSLEVPFPTSFLNSVICVNAVINPIIYGVFNFRRSRN